MMNTGAAYLQRGIDARIPIEEEDINVMRAVRRIVSKGNNAEIKQTSEGKLKVFEVSKKIVKDC